MLPVRYLPVAFCRAHFARSSSPWPAFSLSARQLLTFRGLKALPAGSCSGVRLRPPTPTSPVPVTASTSPGSADEADGAAALPETMVALGPRDLAFVETLFVARQTSSWPAGYAAPPGAGGVAGAARGGAQPAEGEGLGGEGTRGKGGRGEDGWGDAEQGKTRTCVAGMLLWQW